jgi:hypothetical protein
MTNIITSQSGLRFARRATVLTSLSLLVAACSFTSTNEREDVGEGQEAVVGVKDYAPASADRGDALFGAQPAKGAEFKPMCSGAISTWKDAKNKDKLMVTATTAAHCVDSNTDKLAITLPNIDVDGKPALVNVSNWKRSGSGDELAAKGDVAISTFDCGNLFKPGDAWPLAAEAIPKNTKVDVHGGRQVKNPNHPNEVRENRYGKGDVFGADDFKKLFALTEPMVETAGRAGVLASWMTRPGDSGSNGKVDGKLAYVHHGYHGKNQSSGTRVTEAYMVALWNSSIEALEADGYDSTNDAVEIESLDAGAYRQIACSSTGLAAIAGIDWPPPLSGSPTAQIDIKAIGTAHDIGEFWDTPNVLIDTTSQLPSVGGGGIPPHSTINWTFTRKPVPPPDCDPNAPPKPGVVCTGGGGNAPAGHYWVRIIRWPSDDGDTPQILLNGCDPASFSEPSVPTKSPSYNYTVELAGCPDDGGTTSSSSGGTTTSSSSTSSGIGGTTSSSSSGGVGGGGATSSSGGPMPGMF